MKFYPLPSPALYPHRAVGTSLAEQAEDELHLPTCPHGSPAPASVLLRAAARVQLHLLIQLRLEHKGMKCAYSFLATIPKPRVLYFCVPEAIQNPHKAQELWCNSALASPTCADRKTTAPANTFVLFFPPVNSTSEFQKLLLILADQKTWTSPSPGHTNTYSFTWLMSGLKSLPYPATSLSNSVMRLQFDVHSP